MSALLRRVLRSKPRRCRRRTAGTVLSRAVLQWAAVRAMAISAEHERAIRSGYRAREVGRVPVQTASGFRVVALGK